MRNKLSVGNKIKYFLCLFILFFFVVGIISACSLVNSRTSKNTEKRPSNSTSTSFYSNDQPTSTIKVLKVSPTDTSSGTSARIDTTGLLFYKNDDFGISFYYPSYANVQVLDYPIDNYQGVEISYGLDGPIIDIDFELNQNKISPRQWFEKNKNNYNQYIREISDSPINGHPAYFLGIPDTCATTPMILGIISVDNKLYKFLYFDLGKQSVAKELGLIMETFTIDKQKLTQTTILDKLLQIPEAPNDIVCP